MSDQWNFPSDEEIADSRPARDGSRVFLTTLKADTPHVFYFLSMPGDYPGIDWLNYRELNTREGLKVGPDLPSELTFGLLVQDYERIENPATGRREYRYDNNLDPITAGTPGNQMWAVGARNTDSNGLIRVQWRCGINVVDAITGYHKILKVSFTARDDLKKYFETAKQITEDNGNDFDITGRPYEVLYTGEGFKWNVAMRSVKPGSSVIRDGKSVTVQSPDIPDLIDVRQVLIEQREEMDAILASLPTRSGESVDTTIEPDLSGLDVFKPGNLPGEGDGGSDLSEKYKAMSPARLRSMLAKAQIDAQRGATKDDLVNLAVAHLG